MGTLSNIFLGILLIDCLVGFYDFLTKRLDRKVLPLLLAVTCSFFDEVVANYFKIKYHNNLAVYYFGEAFEFAFFAWFIYENLISRVVRKFITVSVWLFIAAKFGYGYWYINKAYADPFYALTIQDYFTIAQGILLTILSICYFKGIFDSISRFEHLNIYVLLAIAGILFYYAFSAIYFAAETYLVGLSLREDPHLYADIFKLKLAAFSNAYNELRNIKMFLFLTNMLLYLCILTLFFKNAFCNKAVSKFQL